MINSLSNNYFSILFFLWVPRGIFMLRQQVRISFFYTKFVIEEDGGIMECKEFINFASWVYGFMLISRFVNKFIKQFDIFPKSFTNKNIID